MLSHVNRAGGRLCGKNCCHRKIIGDTHGSGKSKKDIRNKYYQRKSAFSNLCFVKREIYQILVCVLELNFYFGFAINGVQISRCEMCVLKPAVKVTVVSCVMTARNWAFE